VSLRHDHFTVSKAAHQRCLESLPRAFKRLLLTEGRGKHFLSEEPPLRRDLHFGVFATCFQLRLSQFCKEEKAVTWKSNQFMRRRFNLNKTLDAKKWIGAAIKDEERYPSDPLWRDAPSAEKTYEHRLRRIKLPRKHGQNKFRCSDNS
jgi:hypothetical protein